MMLQLTIYLQLIVDLHFKVMFIYLWLKIYHAFMKTNYVIPESEEIKVQIENNIMSDGTVIGPGDEEPD